MLRARFALRRPLRLQLPGPDIGGLHARPPFLRCKSPRVSRTNPRPRLIQMQLLGPAERLEEVLLGRVELTFLHEQVTDVVLDTVDSALV